MPYERGKVFSTVLDEDAKLELERLAKSTKKSQRIIASHAIMQVAPMRMLDRDWEARIKELEGVRAKADQEREQYAGLKNACANMTFAKKNYICVRANLGKPPTIKALSEDLDEANKICVICEEDTRKKLDRNLVLERVHELEAQLDAKTSEKFKVPICNYGAHLSTDGISFDACRLNPGKNVSIESYCKLRMNGKPCSSYVERLIGVGKKL